MKSNRPLSNFILTLEWPKIYVEKPSGHFDRKYNVNKDCDKTTNQRSIQNILIIDKSNNMTVIYGIKR